MAGMAGIACSSAPLQGAGRDAAKFLKAQLDIGVGRAYFMARRTSLLATRQAALVQVGLRLHGGEGMRVLALPVLIHLGLMTLGADVWSRNQDIGYIASGGVVRAMAGYATHLRLAVLALLPVRNNLRRGFGMAIDALSVRGRRCGRLLS